MIKEDLEILGKIKARYTGTIFSTKEEQEVIGKISGLINPLIHHIGKLREPKELTK